ncbi:MAG: hypothetical protein ABIP81_05930 [Terriglobales bacterium]
MNQNKPYPTCQHIMPSGRLCQCPQIAGIRLCVNHSRDHQRLRNLAKAREVKNYANPKRPDFRPMDDLNAEIFDSLKFPALEDPAAIAITLTNAGRLLGGRHISVREAECLGNLCRIAEINLRKGNAFFRSDMPAGLTDNDPVKPFGDAEGFVMPEEGPIKASHEELKRDFGTDRANRVRTELGYNDHMLEPLAVASTEKKPASSAEPDSANQNKEVA